MEPIPLLLTVLPSVTAPTSTPSGASISYALKTGGGIDNACTVKSVRSFDSDKSGNLYYRRHGSTGQLCRCNGGSGGDYYKW